jgi:hypothetical protein
MADQFQYAIVQVVPRVERNERFNAGLVVFCRTRDWLRARTELDEQLLLRMSPQADVAVVRAHLDAIEHVAAGEAAGGAIARLPIHERFHWLVAPSSTVLQPSPVHTGLCDEPEATFEKLYADLVAR